jgi:hypothetical protein
MLYIKTITSEDRMNSLRDYVVSTIGDSLLLKDGCSSGTCFQLEKSTIISAVDFDETHCFMSGFGADSSPCEEWLVATILAFLESEDFPLVLIEDFVAKPGDTVFSHQPTAPMWCYRDSVFWPIQKELANVESCMNSLAWAAGGPKAIFFFNSVDLSDLERFTFGLQTERMLEE